MKLNEAWMRFTHQLDLMHPEYDYSSPRAFGALFGSCDWLVLR